MKFYSEQLGKFFDSEKECLEAEEAERAKKIEEAMTKKKAEAEKEKEQKKVDDAIEAVKAAKKEYDEALEKVRELAKQYCEDVEAIVNPAKEKVDAAKQAEREAIENFNKKYGVFKTNKDIDTEDFVNNLVDWFDPLGWF